LTKISIFDQNWSFFIHLTGFSDPEVTNLFYNGKATNGEIETKITGKVPEWVSGCMNRNGPGIFDIGNESFGS